MYALSTLRSINIDKLAIISFISCLVAWGYLFNQSITSAIDIWTISEIFNHCYLVIPGALYLIYRQRGELAQTKPEPCYWLLLPILALVLLQIFGAVGQIQLFTHIAVFVGLPLIIVLLIGFKSAMKIPFPLVFMILAIPVGEQLIPHLQEITADMSVALLKLTGIPVFRNGLYIDIPAGKFLVAEACSGISFFISSIAFGSLYAHLSYQSNKAKILFFLFSALIPIFANSLRVYGIIIIAHVSDMKYAVGADHLIYGWFFYALVLFLIFFIGERFRVLPDTKIEDINTKYLISKSWNFSHFSRPLITLVVVFSLAGAWQTYILMPSSYQQEARIQLNKPESFSAVDHTKNWGVSFNKPSQSLSIRSEKNPKFNYHIASFEPSNSEGELVSSMNKLYKVDHWTLVKKLPLREYQALPQDAKALVLVTSSGQTKLLLQWYTIGGFVSGSNLKTKLYGTYKKLIASHQTEFSTSCAFNNTTALTKDLVDECLATNQYVLDN